jgi:hypothetical protein
MALIMKSNLFPIFDDSFKLGRKEKSTLRISQAP